MKFVDWFFFFSMVCVFSFSLLLMLQFCTALIFRMCMKSGDRTMKERKKEINVFNPIHYIKQGVRVTSKICERNGKPLAKEKQSEKKE